MRWRLLIVLTLLGAITVAAFAVPLGVSLAESRTREFLLTRDADLQRFTALANSYVNNGRPGALFDELRAYRDLYGEPIAVVSTRGAPPFTVDLDTDDPAVAGAVSRALRNQQDNPLEFLTPWSSEHIILAKTAGTDANINGAVVVSTSTAQARSDIARSWLFVLVGVVAALAALVAFAMAVSGWVLRPLGRLSQEIEQLSDGLPFRPSPTDDQDGTPVTPGKGPPELRSLSRTFNRMARAVRGSNQAQRRLVADTAHQLRNPLAALQLRLDALDGLVAPAAETGYQRAVDESVRLAEILDDLLALSAAEAAARTERSEPPWCLPRSVVADRVQFWQHAADLQRTVLQITDGGSDRAAAIGPGELGQVLDVLLDNACKYAGAGTTVTVDVRALTPAASHDGAHNRSRVVVTVADNGRGVPVDELQRLTDRFYRGSSAHSPDGSARPGTGLGLAIVDALLTAAGAELAVSQTAGGGLTFTIIVPAAENISPDVVVGDDHTVVAPSVTQPGVRRVSAPSPISPLSMTRRSLLKVIGLASLAPLAVACQSTNLPVYRLASAELNGFFYEFAQLLSDAVGRDDAPFRLERSVTLGTLENLQLLRDGAVPLALALADATVSDPAGRVALGRVYENYLQVVVAKNSPITSIDDFPGYRISLGFPGSGTENSARRVLTAAGMDPGSFTLEPVPLVELLDALASGRIDAGFFAGGVPNPVVDPASAGGGPAGGIRLLSLSGPLRALQQQFGAVYQSVIVPPGVYGSAAEVETVGITSLVLAAPDLPDDVAGRIVDVLLRRAGELIPGAALGAQYLSASSLIYTFGIPLHPGAAAAYRAHHG